MFKEKSEFNKAFIYSFPESVRSLKDWDSDTLSYYQDITFGSAPVENNIEEFRLKFIAALEQVSRSGEAEDTKELTRLLRENKEDLYYGNQIVITRGFGLEYESYLAGRLTPLSKENDELNRLYMDDVIFLLIPAAEIINHRFPKANDEERRYIFGLEVDRGFLGYKVTDTYLAGEEVSVSYSPVSRNSEMLLKYGMAELGNLNNEVIVTIPMSYWNLNGSPSKVKLGNLVNGLPIINENSETYVQYNLNRKSEFSTELANYMRIYLTTEAIADKKVTQNMLSTTEKSMLSTYNEVSAMNEYINFVEEVISAKRSRVIDEADYNTLKQMESSKNYSIYTHTQIYDRINAVIAAIDEKCILSQKIMIAFARIQELAYEIIQAEIDNNLYW